MFVHLIFSINCFHVDKASIVYAEKPIKLLKYPVNYVYVKPSNIWWLSDTNEYMGIVLILIRWRRHYPRNNKLYTQATHKKYRLTI